jgi:hypothetical protein
MKKFALLPLAGLAVLAACDADPTMPVLQPDGNAFYSISVPDSDRFQTADGNDNLVSIVRPTTVDEGDILIVHIALHQQTTKVICPVQSGWTQIRSDNHGDDNRPVQTLFWREATNAEPTAYTFHIKLTNCEGSGPTSGNRNWIAGVIAYAGVDAAGPIAAHAATVQNTEGNTATAPSVEAPAGARVLRFFTEHEGENDLADGEAGLLYVQVRGSAAAAIDGDHTGGATGTLTVALHGENRWIAATVALKPAPTTCTAASVTTHPQAETITYGANATFTAAGSGDPTPTVKWQVHTDGGDTWSDLSGETSTTLSLTKPTVAMSGNQYRAVFTNECSGTQTATSNAATLTVHAKELTVAGITASNKPWDGNDIATIDVSGATLVGVVVGDVVTLDTSNATGDFASSDVGTHVVTISGLTISGADVENYTLIQPTTTASILAWHLEGFRQPVGLLSSIVVAAPATLPGPVGETIWNTVRSGATVPLKFNVYNAHGGGEITTVEGAFDENPFSLAQVACPTNGAFTTEVLDFATAGNTSLRYDPTEHLFIQNWATPRSRAGSCFRVAVTTKDGSHIAAFFQFR